MADQHVTVCLANDEVVLSEELHQVHGIDLLSVFAVNPAECVQKHELILLGEHLPLDFTLAQGYRVC